MGFFKRARKGVRNIGHAGKKIIKFDKKLGTTVFQVRRGGIKKRAGIAKKWGGAVAAVVGGSSAASAIGGGSTPSISDPFSSFMPEESPVMPDALPAESATPSEAGFAPGIDKKWLFIGAAIVIGLFLLTSKTKAT